jgi:hypothetical protein
MQNSSKLILLLLFSCAWFPVHADDTEDTEEKESPWLLVPIVSVDPKLGTSVGVLAGYIFKIDPESTSSMVFTTVSTSDSDSTIGGVFSQLFFDQDRQKLLLGVVGGNINNDYEDFLGSGIPAQTTDDLEAVFARYLHVVKGDWYMGAQVVSSNYSIGADDFFDPILDLIGLTGFNSTGLGLVGEYDTRDNQRNPTDGQFFQFIISPTANHSAVMKASMCTVRNTASTSS